MKNYLKVVVFIIACLSFNPGCWAAQSYESLKAAVGKYIDFLKLVGNSDEKTFSDQVPSLVTTDFKKVINGKLSVAGSAKFAPQLQKLREKMGTWTIENLDTIVSPEDHSAVVRYVLKLPKKRDFTTIAILRYNDQGMLTEVNEVYHKFEGK